MRVVGIPYENWGPNSHAFRMNHHHSVRNFSGILFQHDGMTSCGFDAQKKLNKKNSTLSWSFECGNLAKWVLGVAMCVMSRFFWYLHFLPGKNLLEPPSSKRRRVVGGKFLCQRQAAGWNQKAANWDPHWPRVGVNHPRLILGKCLGDSIKTLSYVQLRRFFF